MALFLQYGQRVAGAVRPPQLDEFFLAEEAPLRAHELAELGLREAEIWPSAPIAR
jgi:hypothetical protein